MHRTILFAVFPRCVPTLAVAAQPNMEPGQQGAEMRMTMDMRLLGDRVEGESVTKPSMSGESMEMRSRVEGRRVGDC